MNTEKETLLIVEDDPTVRCILQAVLEASYHVMAASSAEDALKLGHTHAAPIDLAIIDYRLPGMDGLVFAQTTGVPFIITTTDLSTQNIEAWGEAGAFGYLPKPIVEPASVLHVVATALFNSRRHARIERVLEKRKHTYLAMGLIMWRDRVTAEEAEKTLKANCHQRQKNARTTIENIAVQMLNAHATLCGVRAKTKP